MIYTDRQNGGSVREHRPPLGCARLMQVRLLPHPRIIFGIIVVYYRWCVSIVGLGRMVSVGSIPMRPTTVLRLKCVFHYLKFLVRLTDGS